jgi:hypothetical protein
MKAAGAIIFVLALVIGLVPLFTDCQSQGKAITLANGSTIPMKCHWTGRAELALAVPLLFVGGLMAGSRRRQTLRSISLLGLVLGISAILIPSVLIGVCSNPDMLCNMLMRPTLIFAGTLVSATNLAVLVALRGPEVEPVMG